MSTLRAEGLRLRYPAQTHWALEGITTTFEPGVTWLAGPLGAGTSTLLGALAGLLPRLSGGDGAGTATLDGADVAASSPLDLGIGWLGPAPALQLSGVAGTVRDEIAVGPMNLGWPRERIRAAVEAAMARTDVAHLADRAPNALSGGETQRVLLAALLA
ncbi:MAG TPA: ATP-binding cassette domain-containing protein, partial [Gemmatimonadales bacterium]|nr:ATP-binding cassette domain-containing protein [Gemmatimonadales bacterium]